VFFAKVAEDLIAKAWISVLSQTDYEPLLLKEKYKIIDKYYLQIATFNLQDLRIFITKQRLKIQALDDLALVPDDALLRYTGISF